MSKDLMFQDEIKNAVREAYGSISSGAGEPVVGLLYSDEEVAELPAGAREWALGVGNPVRYAFLQLARTPPMPAWLHGRSSCTARWSRSRSRTPRSTW
jgi:hypothetical protein